MILQLVHPTFPYLKYAVPAVASLIVVAYVILGRRHVPSARNWLLVLLGITAVFAGFDWAQVAWQNKDLVNSYEFFHYYLPSKYANELGYTQLYGAAIVAEKELGHPFIAASVRDLETSRSVSTKSVLENAEKYRDRFTQPRWEEFKRDVHYFRRDFKGDSGWQRMLNDKGYNGTPVWTMIGGIFANVFPTSSEASMTCLALIDWFYFFAAMGCVAWAFGVRSALLLASLLLTHYVAYHGTLKAAFIRLDWVMCLLMAICCVRKERYAIAGALTAFAALSRVFPVIFVFGVAAKAAWGLWEDRALHEKYRRFLAAFCATCALLLLASLAYTSIDYWKQFIDKIAGHSDDISAWRVGFKYIFLWFSGSAGHATFEQFLRDYGWLYRVLQVCLLGVTFLLTRRLPDWQAYTFGFIASFILVAPTYYYYIMLGVPFLFFVVELERPLYALGAIHMYLISILGHYWLSIWDRGYRMFFWYSVVIGLGIVAMWGLAGWEWRRGRFAGQHAQASHQSPQTTVKTEITPAALVQHQKKKKTAKHRKRRRVSH